MNLSPAAVFQIDIIDMNFDFTRVLFLLFQTLKRPKMNKAKKLGALLGIKGVLAISSLATIALALVVYTASVTITPTTQFTLGASADSWSVYVNDVDEVRYLPGGDSAPSAIGDTSTYAFRVNSLTRGCVVQIELTSAMSSSLFSKFEITVSYWTGSGWAQATIYNAATGGSTISYIDGTTTTAYGFIRQAAGSGDTYYLVEVTYSYDLVDTTTSVTAEFQYTPLPA